MMLCRTAARFIPFALPLALVACGSPIRVDAGTDVAAVDASGMDITTDAGGSDVHTPITGPQVVAYQYDIQRSGSNRNEQALTVAAVSGTTFHKDAAFAPTLDGTVYAQPLYLSGLSVMGETHDVLFVATQANSLYALDATTGATLWTVNFGDPMPQSSLPCGNIGTQTGVLGTPVIDPAAGTLYAIAYSATGDFNLHAVDVTTGMDRAGYPVAIVPPVSNGVSWDNTAQQERGALSLVDGRLYVAFGGLYGDCGRYHGWVVGIDPANPMSQTSFATTGNAAGIWAPAGPSADGMGHLFVATGNAIAGSYGNHVLRLTANATGPSYVNMPTEYFVPGNTAALDAADLDLGTVSPIPVEHPGSSTPHLLFVSGKFGTGNLLNRDNLGGAATGDGITGEGVFSARVTGQAFGGLGTWNNGTDTFVLVSGRNRNACGGSSGGISALRLTLNAGNSEFTSAWCTDGLANPSSPVVSSNGNNDGILWVTDQQSSQLRAYAMSDGHRIFASSGADAVSGVRQWTPPVVINGHVYVTTRQSVALFRLM